MSRSELAGSDGNSKQPKFSLTDKLIKKMWCVHVCVCVCVCVCACVCVYIYIYIYIYKMEYYSAVKKKQHGHT